MSKDELKSRISIQWKGYGTYKVTIEYRGKFYSCTSHNSLAYDRIKGYADDISDRSVRDFYTYKGALQALWDECKRINDLI
jgi:hypothetical protein